MGRNKKIPPRPKRAATQFFLQFQQLNYFFPVSRTKQKKNWKNNKKVFPAYQPLEPVLAWVAEAKI